MDLEQAIRTRRTHKAFGSQAVDKGVLDELFELARWAPNHHLTNPWRFHVLGADARAALMELAEATQAGSAVKLRRAPTLIAVTASLTGEPVQDREDLLATAVAAYIVLLGAHARLDTARGREILAVGAQEAPVGLLYLGAPVQEQRVPERAPAEHFVTYLD
jgi:nitroreductase